MLFMSLLYVRPVPVYAQGIERLWSRETKDDYWQREFEHIGQQEILNQEVYADGTQADKGTFGYQNRYDEYRRGVNTIAGELRTTQDYWHMARIFANRPALNSDFVTFNPTDRIFQATEQQSDQLYCMVHSFCFCTVLSDTVGVRWPISVNVIGVSLLEPPLTGLMSQRHSPGASTPESKCATPFASLGPMRPGVLLSVPYAID